MRIQRVKWDGVWERQRKTGGESGGEVETERLGENELGTIMGTQCECLELHWHGITQTRANIQCQVLKICMGWVSGK